MKLSQAIFFSEVHAGVAAVLPGILVTFCFQHICMMNDRLTLDGSHFDRAQYHLQQHTQLLERDVTYVFRMLYIGLPD